MPSHTQNSRAKLDALARDTGFSNGAVETMLDAILRGGGRMAQFDHREFGGAGQWMRGGMLMVSAPSNRDLERRIDLLCDGLADLVEREPRSAAASFQVQTQTSGGESRVQDSRSSGRAFETPRQDTWYPAGLGAPDSSGAQNDSRYAWFRGTRRLAVDDGRTVTVYDTGDHQIGGVSQQQGAGGSVSFVSQHGRVDIDRLPVIEGERPTVGSPASTAHDGDPALDPFQAIEKLAGLHARGILGDDEFAAKKAQLLERI